MADLVFEDPPEHRPDKGSHGYDVKKNSDRELLIVALSYHPKRWAIISRHLSRNRAGQVARMLRERHPRLYEFRAAANPDGEGVVYGRYVGPDANI